MQNVKTTYLNLLVISASIVCFEIVSTRVSSVIFVSNYAFIILSVAILGLGLGGIYSHYKIKPDAGDESYKAVVKYTFLIGISLVLFIGAVILLVITNPFVYFLLLSLPFFFGGIVFSQLYKLFAGYSFTLYAYDLAGAAAGAVGTIFILN